VSGELSTAAIGRSGEGLAQLAGSWRRILLPLFVLQGALLMFMLEPMLGRRLVAAHGAGFHVWNTCMMFYSGGLLAGYLYAHWVVPRVGRWHLVFVFASLLWTGAGAVPEPGFGGPVLSVLFALMKTAAVPFCVLATTSVVAQQWLASSSEPGSDDPYHLYAASNVGSLLGLLAYPLLIEPLLGLEAQGRLWGALLVSYAGVAFVLAPRGKIRSGPSAESRAVLGTTAPASSLVSYWFALSMAPSMALLAITNLIANSLGSIPLVWVAPLGVYLATFILAYRTRSGRGPWLRRNAPELCVLLAIALTGSLAGPLGLLFGVALAGHSELHRTRPDPRHLTHYYLVVAAGGWAGAAFVSLVAPHLFSDLYEWPLSLVLLSGTLLAGRRLAPIVVPGGGETRRRRVLRLVVIAATAGTLFNFFARGLVEGFDAVTLRNPFGVYRISSTPAGARGDFDAAGTAARYLLHGGTVHGLQLSDPERRSDPVGYYHPASPLGDVLSSLEGPVQVAVMGLGTGTASVFFGADDEVTFYELDPDGEGIARRYFSFLDDSEARIRVVEGDARLSLARDPLAPDGHFDLVFLDAFSGDALPAHLLTREAMQLYMRKLSEDGILLVHVSSRFYEFEPIVKAAAEALGLAGVTAQSTPPLAPMEMSARAYLLARRPERLAAYEQRGWQRHDAVRAATLWTDDYVNVLAPLWGGLTRR
jgi:spermidine synthase